MKLSWATTTGISCLGIASVWDVSDAHEEHEDKRLRGAALGAATDVASRLLPISVYAEDLQGAFDNPGTVLSFELLDTTQPRRRLGTVGDSTDTVVVETSIDEVPCPKRELLCEMNPNLGTFECKAYEPPKKPTSSDHSCDDDCKSSVSNNSYCDDSVLDVLDTLETSNSAEAASDLINPEDLSHFVELVRAQVTTDGLELNITNYSVIDAFFPDPSATRTLIDSDLLPVRTSAAMMTSGDGPPAPKERHHQTTSEEELHRSLAMCRDCDDKDEGLHDFFSEKPKACFAATTVVLASTFELAFTALGVPEASQLASTATWKLMMKEQNKPLLSYLFEEMLNGEALDDKRDVDSLAFSLASYLFRQVGISSMWCMMSESMTTGELLRTACDMLLEMTALSTTNGAWMVEGMIGQLDVPLDSFYESLMEWGEECFDIDDRMEEEDPEEEEPSNPNPLRCPSDAPSCEDIDSCTNNIPRCDETTGYAWTCERTPVTCAGNDEVCDPTDGICKAKRQCPQEVPSCSGDRCNDSNPKCNESTGHAWTCETTPRVCSDSSQSCDPADGVCKNDDQLAPCIAVIDEDDSFKAGFFSRSQRRIWEDFREDYPDRYFCLLVPKNRRGDKMRVPQNFLDDPKTVVHYNMPRDNGDTSKAANWFELCGLEGYTSANVQWVGLFIDDSGSLRESEVRASRDRLYNKLSERGIQVQKVVNTQENWIKPFLTKLVP